jgi:HEPN domain-containing protein
MSMQTWTLDRFRSASRGHLYAARNVLAAQQKSKTKPPAAVPTSAAYLAHVALECALKARLLYRGGFASAEELKKKHPRVHAKLFHSARGHDIPELAGELRLESFVALNGKTLANDACWKRLCSSERPYALRYGAQQLREEEATEEVDRASDLAEQLLSGVRGKREKHG